MARPHIEFIHARNVPFAHRADGAEVKVLNRDPLCDEATMIVRYPPGYSAGPNEAESGAEEFLVLAGAITIDGMARGYHAYGFLPQGSGLAGVAEAIAIDTPAMPWDISTYDPKLAHLRLARKVLRLGPNDSGRTFLLTGMAHGVPTEARMLPAETHDHAEEMYMLQGAMWAPEGRMGAGAYFYRPAGIVHGPHVSETGFLQIMRSPGANAIVTRWSDELRPLPIGVTYAPVLPEGTPVEWAAAVPSPEAW